MILAWVHAIDEGVSAFVGGMGITARFLTENLRNQGGATSVTRQYPQEPAEVIGDRQRGHLVNDAEACIVCNLCAKACPVDCFVMEMERTEDNKPRASRFDIDISKCLTCGLCTRVCPTGSLKATADFEVDPRGADGRYLFRRNTDQLDRRLEAPDVVRMARVANQTSEERTAEDQAWLDEVTDPEGRHLIGMYGLGYYPADVKAAVEAERAAKAAAKAAAAAAAKAAAAAAAAAAPKPEAVSKPEAVAKPESAS